MIAKTWTEASSYVAADRRAVGHDWIDAMIEKAQEKFPGYRCHWVSGIEAHNDYVRFSYAAGGSWPEQTHHFRGSNG